MTVDIFSPDLFQSAYTACANQIEINRFFLRNVRLTNERLMRVVSDQNDINADFAQKIKTSSDLITNIQKITLDHETRLVAIEAEQRVIRSDFNILSSNVNLNITTFQANINNFQELLTRLTTDNVKIHNDINQIKDLIDVQKLEEIKQTYDEIYNQLDATISSKLQPVLDAFTELSNNFTNLSNSVDERINSQNTTINDFIASQNVIINNQNNYIKNEVARLDKADNDIKTDIVNRENATKDRENQLNTNLTNKINDLNTTINQTITDNVQTLVKSISDETQARTEADSNLQKSIDDYQQRVATIEGSDGRQWETINNQNLAIDNNYKAIQTYTNSFTTAIQNLGNYNTTQDNNINAIGDRVTTNENDIIKLKNNSRVTGVQYRIKRLLAQNSFPEEKIAVDGFTVTLKSVTGTNSQTISVQIPDNYHGYAVVSGLTANATLTPTNKLFDFSAALSGSATTDTISSIYCTRRDGTTVQFRKIELYYNKSSNYIFISFYYPITTDENPVTEL